jgi:hypothetical protein
MALTMNQLLYSMYYRYKGYSAEKLTDGQLLVVNEVNDYGRVSSDSENDKIRRRIDKYGTVMGVSKIKKPLRRGA